MSTKELTLLLKTFQENKIPFPLEGTTFNIVGQDLVIESSTGVIYQIPYAAQFASLSDQSFTLAFSDGQKISSKEVIIKSVKNFTNKDGFLSSDHGKDNIETNKSDHSNNNKNTQAGIENKTIVVTIEKAIVNNQSDEIKKIIDIVDENQSADNISSDELLSFQPINPVVIHSSKSTIKTAEVIINKETVKIAEVIIDRDYDFNKLDKLNQVKVLQPSDHLDYASHTAIISGGDRNNGSYESQYGVKYFNLDDQKSGWKIDARVVGSENNESTLTKIIQMNDFKSVDAISYPYSPNCKFITWNSKEGALLGLHENEVAIIYNTTLNEIIRATINTTSADGTKSILQIGIDKSSSLNDQDDSLIHIGSTHARLVIKGSQGDDTFIASDGLNIYDGFMGKNSVDFSHINKDTIFNYQSDNFSEFAKFKITDSSSAVVTIGDKTQFINNFDKVFGSSTGNNIFITGKGDREYFGGSGNDRFIAYNDSNIFHGGGGENILDYSKIGSHYFGRINISDGKYIDVNGLKINTGSKSTEHSGVNQNAISKDHFEGINEFFGSSYNDEVFLNDLHGTLHEQLGSNYIWSGDGSYVIYANDKSYVDYSLLKGKVNIDLNSGIVNKYNGSQDHLSDVHKIVGSNGGGNLIGKTGSDNVLIGTSGNIKFYTEGGNSIIIGGDNHNEYTISNGVSEISAHGLINNIHAKDMTLRFHGSEKGEDNLFLSGGRSVINAGSGASRLDLTDNAFSEIILDNEGAFTLYSGDCYSQIHGNAKSFEINFSHGNSGKISADLDHGIINSSNGGQIVLNDTIINKIISGENGDGNYIFSTYDSALTIDAWGDGNRFETGKADGNNITVDSDGYFSSNNYFVILGKNGTYKIFNSGGNNTLDYSKYKGVLCVDLNNKSQLNNDNIDGFDRVIANNDEKGIFYAKEMGGSFFDLSGVTGADIYSGEGGSADFKLKNNNTDNIFYNKISGALEFNITNNNISVKKSVGTDTYDNLVSKIYGNDQGGKYVLDGNFGWNNKIDIEAGNGNNEFSYHNTGGNSDSVFTGGTGENIFTYIQQSSSSKINFSNSKDGHFDFSLDYTNREINANSMTHLIYDVSKGTSSNFYYNDANHINLEIQGQHSINTNRVYIHANGGGNIFTFNNNAVLNYDLSRTKGLNANFDSGIISFTDKVDNDIIRGKVNYFGATVGDDVVHLSKNNAMHYLVSAGNDKVWGSDGVGHLYDTPYGGDFHMDTGIYDKKDYAGKDMGQDHLYDLKNIVFNDANASAINLFEGGTDSSDFNFDFNVASQVKVYGNIAGNHTFNNVKGSDNISFDYSGLDHIDVNLYSGIINKGNNYQDTLNGFTGNTLRLLGSNGDDTFLWKTVDDFLNVSSLDGGKGKNTLEQSSDGATVIDLSSLANTKNFNIVDVSKVQHKSIVGNFDSLFNNSWYKGHNIDIIINNKDDNVVKFSTSNEWDHHYDQTSQADVYENRIDHSSVHVIHAA
ncbi:hypothetical protein AAGR22_07970 [Erwinia sp. HDF1-3R]|uniref:hypothetical protein n=1 Tax=Erwinia sp. HDF1-3R TaxID=3141543 RepID=UPI0031F4AEF1